MPDRESPDTVTRSPGRSYDALRSIGGPDVDPGRSPTSDTELRATPTSPSVERQQPAELTTPQDTWGATGQPRRAWIDDVRVALWPADRNPRERLLDTHAGTIAAVIAGLLVIGLVFALKVTVAGF